MPTTVSKNLDLINRAERVLRDDEGKYDLVEHQAVIEKLVGALISEETDNALLRALVSDGDTSLPTEKYTSQYRVTYPLTRTLPEPLETRTFNTAEAMLDLALFVKQDSPHHAEHVVMEARDLFAGQWKRL